MPALRGSLTYVRFFVEGELPKDAHATFLQAIQKNVMRPLEAEEEVNERSGWCQIGDPFALELEEDDVFFEDYVNLGFRTDKWVIPGPMLRAKLREAEAAHLEKRGRERLSKREKVELKALVSKKLRKQLAPSTRTIDFSWSLEERVIRFFSQSAPPAAVMEELFQRTFGLKLVPEAPYTLAARLGVGETLTKAEEKAWDELVATSFEDLSA